MKKQIKLTVILFLLVLLPISLFAIKRTDSSAEYRHITVLNDIKAAPITRKASVINDFIDDNMPARQETNKIVSSLSLSAGLSPNDDVIIGKEDWLYFADSIKWHTHETTVDEATINKLVTNLSTLAERLQGEKSELVIFIAPDKASVYPEYIPDSIRLENTNTDAIISALKNNGISVVFPREELMSYKPDYTLYAKYDTHWLSTGAYIATRMLVTSLGSYNPPISDLAFYPRDCTGNDLARLINMSDVFPLDTDYDFVGYGLNRQLPNLISWEPNGDGKTFHTANSFEKEVYVLHDSYWEAMEPFFTIAFSDTFVRHFDYYQPGEIYSKDSGLVVIEVCERSLLRLTDLDF